MQSNDIRLFRNRICRNELMSPNSTWFFNSKPTRRTNNQNVSLPFYCVCAYGVCCYAAGRLVVRCQSIINQWIFRYFLCFFFHLTGELIIINKKSKFTFSDEENWPSGDTCKRTPVWHWLPPNRIFNMYTHPIYISYAAHIFVILIFNKAAFASFSYM